MILECIKDDGYDPNMMAWIQSYPVKGEFYYLRKRVHTMRGLGYLLDEIHNDPMPNGEEPSFHNKRFRPVQDNVEGIKEMLKEETEVLA